MVNVTNANTTMLVYNMVTSTLYLQLMPLSSGTVTVTVPAGTMTDSYVSNRSKRDRCALHPLCLIRLFGSAEK